MIDPSSGPHERFYPSRLLLQWSETQLRELEEFGRSGLARVSVERRLRPLAHSAIANLRATLEQVALETAAEACPNYRAERVGFPIARDAVTFRSMMLTRFPGLRTNRPAVWRVLSAQQVYANGGDAWLETLHGLWNRKIPVEDRAPGPTGAEFPLVLPDGRDLAEFLADSRARIATLLEELEAAFAVPVAGRPRGRGARASAAAR